MMEEKCCKVCGNPIPPIVVRKVVDLTYSDSNMTKYVMSFPRELWSYMAYHCSKCDSPCEIPIKVDDEEAYS